MNQGNVNAMIDNTRFMLILAVAADTKQELVDGWSSRIDKLQENIREWGKSPVEVQELRIALEQDLQSVAVNRQAEFINRSKKECLTIVSEMIKEFKGVIL